VFEEKEHSAEAADAHKADQYEDRQRYAKGAIVVFHVCILLYYGELVKKYFDGIFGRTMRFVVAISTTLYGVIARSMNVGVGASATFAIVRCRDNAVEGFHVM